ncbi:MAG: aminoglycoside phosphotransferase family protein [Dehalococcoidia bacterium]|nr:MAG: aminoglycoside phosphotransferase family protein [Dehalococcoidia bacterium]
MTDPLPARALDWVRSAVPGARGAHTVERFAGATTSSLHAIEVERAGAPPLALVLRRYTDAKVRAEEPQFPRTEAAALRLLDGAPGVIAPRLIAVDETGEACDVPAVLMTRIEGRPTLTPEDIGVWVRGLAEALAAIHHLDGATLEGSYERWHDPVTLRPPSWTRQPEAWARLVEASHDLEPSGEVVLLHRDYHPGNVLWSGGAVSGIVDWPNACRGIAALDAGHCRRDVVMTHGVEVAEAFLAAYGEASGRAPDALCDALALLDCALVAGGHRASALAAYHAYGRADLSLELVCERLDEYATLIARRL